MSQPPAFTAGVFLRNQTEIARDLLATAKPLRLSDESVRRPEPSERPLRDGSSVAGPRDGFPASCSMTCVSSVIVGFSRSGNSNRSRRRRLDQGAKRKDSSCCRPCSLSRSVVFLRTRLSRISAASPIYNSSLSSASSRSNQRACPLASIPTRTFLPCVSQVAVELLHCLAMRKSPLL